MRTRQRVPPEKAALQIRLFQLGTGVKRERPREDGDVKILSLLDHPSANERHKILGRHRNTVPTFVERAIWGPGDGTDLVSYDTDICRIGGPVCVEQLMPPSRPRMLERGPAFP